MDYDDFDSLDEDDGIQSTLDDEEREDDEDAAEEDERDDELDAYFMGEDVD